MPKRRGKLAKFGEGFTQGLADTAQDVSQMQMMKQFFPEFGNTTQGTDSATEILNQMNCEMDGGTWIPGANGQTGRCSTDAAPGYPGGAQSRQTRRPEVSISPSDPRYTK
jgi:hypothetical protein